MPGGLIDAVLYVLDNGIKRRALGIATKRAECNGLSPPWNWAIPARSGGPRAQELEIAMLAATGLSNKRIGSRLLLSHRTVGAHLYRVFPRLGINTRAALRDALAAMAEAA